MRSKRFRKLTAFFVLCCFGLSEQRVPEVYGSVAVRAAPKENFETLNVDELELSRRLGKIEETYRGSKDQTVVLIQDAHAIPDAQRSIQKLISYFQKRYGVDFVGLEGASSHLDALMFKSFPDQDVLREVFREYLEKGELTAGTASAIFNSSESDYAGLEDWELYQDGLRYYLLAQKSRTQIREVLQEIGEKIRIEKERLYPEKLREVDAALSDFQQDKKDLVAVLRILGKTKKPPEGSRVRLIYDEAENGEKREAAHELEVRKIAEVFDRPQIARRMPRETYKEFQYKRQQFQTSQISSSEFALYLSQIAGALKIPVPVSDKLIGAMRLTKQLKNMEGVWFFREFQAYAREVKASLIETEEQRRLDREGEERDLLERFSRMELNQEDWEKIRLWMSRASQRSLNVEPGLFSFQYAFYLNAKKRDRVLCDRLMAAKGSNGETVKNAVMVAGGFHAEGLTKLFREKGISYVVIMPEILKLPDEIYYESQMRGDVSWKSHLKMEAGRIDLYSAFVRGTRDKMLEALRASGQGEFQGRTLKAWRDQIIRELSREGRISEAAEYTRYIDEAVLPATEEDAALALIESVKKFMLGMKKLDQENRLTPSNVASLLGPAMLIQAAPANAAARDNKGLERGIGWGEEGFVALSTSLDDSAFEGEISFEAPKDVSEFVKPRAELRTDDKLFSSSGEFFIESEEQALEAASVFAQVLKSPESSAEQSLSAFFGLLFLKESFGLNVLNYETRLILETFVEQIHQNPKTRPSADKPLVFHGGFNNEEEFRQYIDGAENLVLAGISDFEKWMPEKYPRAFSLETAGENDWKISHFSSTGLIGPGWVFQGDKAREEIPQTHFLKPESLIIAYQGSPDNINPPPDFLKLARKLVVVRKPGEMTESEEQAQIEVYKKFQNENRKLEQPFQREKQFADAVRQVPEKLKLSTFRIDSILGQGQEVTDEVFLEELRGRLKMLSLLAEVAAFWDQYKVEQAQEGVRILLDKSLNDSQKGDFSQKETESAYQKLIEELPKEIRVETVRFRFSSLGGLSSRLRRFVMQSEAFRLENLKEAFLLAGQKEQAEKIDSVIASVNNVVGNESFRASPDTPESFFQDAFGLAQRYPLEIYTAHFLNELSVPEFQIFLEGWAKNIVEHPVRIPATNSETQVKFAFKEEKMLQGVWRELYRAAEKYAREKLELDSAAAFEYLKPLREALENRNLKILKGLSGTDESLERQTALSYLRFVLLSRKTSLSDDFVITSKSGKEYSPAVIEEVLEAAEFDLENNVILLRDPSALKITAVQAFLSSFVLALASFSLPASSSFFLSILLPILVILAPIFLLGLKFANRLRPSHPLNLLGFDITLGGVHSRGSYALDANRYLAVSLDGKVSARHEAEHRDLSKLIFQDSHRGLAALLDEAHAQFRGHGKTLSGKRWLDGFHWALAGLNLVYEGYLKKFFPKEDKRKARDYARQTVSSLQRLDNLGYDAAEIRVLIAEVINREMEFEEYFPAFVRQASESREAYAARTRQFADQLIQDHKARIEKVEVLRAQISSQGRPELRSEENLLEKFPETLSRLTPETEEAFYEYARTALEEIRKRVEGYLGDSLVKQDILENYLSPAETALENPGSQEISRISEWLRKAGRMFPGSKKSDGESYRNVKRILGQISQDIARKEKRVEGRAELRVQEAQNIDAAKAQEFLAAHPEELRDLVRFLLERVQYVDQNDFRAALSASIKAFHEAVEGRPFVIVTSKWPVSASSVKSELFIYQQTRENGLREPEGVVEIQNLRGWLENYKKEHPGESLPEILVLDDAAYSGSQLGSFVIGLIDETLTREERAFLPVHLLVPYVTNRAKDHINPNGRVFPLLKFHNSQVMPTVSDMFEEAIEASETPESQAGFEALRNQAFEVYDNADNGVTLTSFWFKQADHASILTSQNASFIEGFVTDGSVGRQRKIISYAPEVRTPPYKTAAFLETLKALGIYPEGPGLPEIQQRQELRESFFDSAAEQAALDRLVSFLEAAERADIQIDIEQNRDVLEIIISGYKQGPEALEQKILARIFVRNAEAVESLLKRLDQLETYTRKFAVGFVMPSGITIDDVTRREFFRGYAEGVREGVGEILFGGTLPHEFRQALEKENPDILIRPGFKPASRTLVLRGEEQSRVPVAAMSDVREALLEGYFSILLGGQTSVDEISQDPDKARLFGKLTARSQVHLARLLEEEHLRNDPALLKSSLIQALKLESDVAENFFALDGEGRGFALNAKVLGQLIEAEMRAVRQALISA